MGPPPRRTFHRTLPACAPDARLPAATGAHDVGTPHLQRVVNQITSHMEDESIAEREGRHCEDWEAERVFGFPSVQTQGPAGARAPSHDLLKQPDFDVEADEGRMYDGPDEDAPPDAVGPRPPVDMDLTEVDLADPAALQATETAAQLGAAAGSGAFFDAMAAAEAAYEASHPPAGGGGGATPSSPRSPRAQAGAHTRRRVAEQLAAALAANARLPTTGRPGEAAAAAAACEEELHRRSRSKATYLSLAANAVRLAATTDDVADLPRVAAGEPKAVAEGHTAGEATPYVTGLQGYVVKPFKGTMAAALQRVPQRGFSSAMAGAPVQHTLCPAQRHQQRALGRTVVECAVAVKLPATHLQASQLALEQLKAAKTNRYATEKRSSIIAIGLSVHTCPVEIREKLAVPEAEWQRAISELTTYPHIEEAAVLSTCNRMEIYVVGLSFHRGVREVEEWMSRASGVPLEQLRPYMFLLRDRDATGHLLRVAGGLDSLVMGEGQILAQVKQVHKVGQNCPGFGRHLNGLFKQAVTAGKRVRSETSISSGAVSVSSAAAELAQLKLPTHSFDDAKVCIIGAGKMSRLLVKHLSSKGCKKVTVLNRSMPRAEALAEEFPEVEFDIHLMGDLMPCIEKCDVIFAASGSEELLVLKDDLTGLPVASAAVGGVRRFVDISVPRNIAPDINELDSAIVYNVDDLKEVVAANKEERARAAAEAEVLLGEEQLAFEAWRDSLETVPTIKALRGKAEAIRAAELDKTLNKLGEGLTNKQKKAVEDLSKGIVNKLLHGPMTALRCDGADPTAVSQTLRNMEALERMFDLQEEYAAGRR
eukprot:scaffold11.g3870.t1